MTTLLESPAAEAAAGGPTSQQLQFLRLTAGGHRYAVRIDAVREILELTRMTQLPLMPSFVCGVMNLRGAVVPVIDLGARLGGDATVTGRRTCVVIVDIAIASDAPHRLGMLVDAVYEVFDSADDQIEPVPRLGTRIDTTFIRGMVRARGDATPELDLDRVLDQAVLAELIAEFATRN